MDLFCQYLNKNNKFIPQINRINGNELILNSLNAFKIGFNQQFITNFYNENNNNLDLYKLADFCKKYGKKIKEITFIDNNIPYNNEAYLIIKYIIQNSNIEKVEDRHHDGDKSILTKLYFENNNLKKIENYKNKEKNFIDVIKGLKSYSLYYHKYNNMILKNAINNILLNGNNIEELEISNIDKENSSSFIKVIKNLDQLKALSFLSEVDDDFFFDEISEVIKENSLYKLKMNLKYFICGLNIINRNEKSLKDLDLNIKHCKGQGKIVKTISKIVNLKYLHIRCSFPIFTKRNISYLSLLNVEFLEIPLFIERYLFDLNTFFQKVPKLKKLIINKIYLSNNKKDMKLFNLVEQYKLNDKLVKNLKKIKILNCKKKYSILIPKLLQFFANSKTKENIKEIKIENCYFNCNIPINNLLEDLSFFKNIKVLKIINNFFEEKHIIDLARMTNFENLEKFYFKNKKNTMILGNLSLFLSNLSKKCKYINEIGLSGKNLNVFHLNLIFDLFQKFKYLTKLSLFDDYSKLDFISNNIGFENNIYLDLLKIKYHCMLDLRNLDLKTAYHCPKVFISKYFGKKNYNKLIKYYSYQNILYDNFNLNKLFYSKKEKAFEIAEIQNNYLCEKDFFYNSFNDAADNFTFID